MGKKKKKKYWGIEVEDALFYYITIDDEHKKNLLFGNIIDNAFKKLIDGVLEMQMFHSIMQGDKEFIFKESCYFHLVNILHTVKFNVNFGTKRIEKDGKEVKFYSYFGTSAKNFLISLKIKIDKHISKYGSTFPIIEEVVGNSKSLSFETQEIGDGFEDKKYILSNYLKKIDDEWKINGEHSISDIVVLKTTIYMIDHWHYLDFQKKDEFKRLLVIYTGLSSEDVSLSFKKIKEQIWKDNIL